MQMEAAESRRIRPVWRENKACGNLVPQKKQPHTNAVCGQLRKERIA